VVLIQDAGVDGNGWGEDPQVSERAAATLRSNGLRAFAVSGSINSRDGCHDVIKRAMAVRGHVDAVIHNAGWLAYETVDSIQEESFDRMIAVATKAPLWLAQAAWPSMKSAGYGRIVLTTSDRALYPQYAQEGLSAYAAAKMAAVGIVHVLALEGAPHGIVVNAISPVAKTRMWGVEDEPDELRPSEVAPGAAFLASDACTEGGWILRASNGQFHATRASEAQGVTYPRDLHAVTAATVDDLASNWRRVAIPAVEPRQ
jgi:NAD(P)-dependent dehydrogenase (short-subunit alcohol dehydrogenase family)